MKGRISIRWQHRGNTGTLHLGVPAVRPLRWMVAAPARRSQRVGCQDPSFTALLPRRAGGEGSQGSESVNLGPLCGVSPAACGVSPVACPGPLCGVSPVAYPAAPAALARNLGCDPSGVELCFVRLSPGALRDPGLMAVMPSAYRTTTSRSPRVVIALQGQHPGGMSAISRRSSGANTAGFRTTT